MIDVGYIYYVSKFQHQTRSKMFVINVYLTISWLCLTETQVLLKLCWDPPPPFVRDCQQLTDPPSFLFQRFFPSILQTPPPPIVSYVSIWLTRTFFSFCFILRDPLRATVSWLANNQHTCDDKVVGIDMGELLACAIPPPPLVSDRKFYRFWISCFFW